LSFSKLEALSALRDDRRCLGGTDELENLVMACRDCNIRKGGRTPEQAGMVLL
jgi:5-methylcytosine-specific restriction endonuclease McrA